MEILIAKTVEILWGLLYKCLTAKFIARTMIVGARAITDKTETLVDDKLINNVEAALKDAGVI
jgi:hypothetical protein